MPRFDDGQRMTEALAWDRMIQSVPASYTIWKSGTQVKAECLLKDGTDYTTGTDDEVIQAAINDANCESIYFKQTQYDLTDALTLKNKLRLIFENRNTELRATSSLTRLIDGRDCSEVHIVGGMINGHDLATTVLDFTQTSGTVTHNRVDYTYLCGAKDTTNSCLLNITQNSGFQGCQPMLDGRVDAAGGSDSAEYGLILDASGGQNTIWLADGWNFCSEAVIRLGGGVLTLIGGSLNGGAGTASNILVTSSSSGPILRVYGTWFESNADNILIEEGSYAPTYLDLMPAYMSAGGSGLANIRSTTTANHLAHLRVQGGQLVNTGGTYNIDCTATGSTIIDVCAYGQDINTAKLSYYNIFHKGAAFTANQPISTAGAVLSSTLDMPNNTAIRWKKTDTNYQNILWMDGSDNMNLSLADGLVYDPKNHADASLSGTAKIVEIDIGGVPYFFKVYPTKT